MPRRAPDKSFKPSMKEEVSMSLRNKRVRMRRTLACLTVLVCLTTIAPVSASAWGNEGHQITALVAYMLLTPRARNNVDAVLAGKKIDGIATWPDDLKRAGEGCVVPNAKGCNPNYRPETSQWHFVDMPLGDGRFDPKGDYCRSSRYGDCIVPAIDDFRDILNRSTRRTFASNGDEQKRKLHDALSFIVHLLGDIHQPLHCAQNNNDGGGNNVLVTWTGEPKYTYDVVWNLHSVWDEYLVDRNISLMPQGKRTYPAYAASLFKKLNKAERDYAQAKASNIESGRAETVVAWAEGSHALAKTSAYSLPSKTVKTSTRGAQKKDRQGKPLDLIVLNEKYFTDNMTEVEGQLRLGAVRLARILNEIYDKDIQ